MWVSFFGLILHVVVVLAKLCLTLCDPADYSTPGFPVFHCLHEFAQTHVHWVGDAIQISHPLSPWCWERLRAGGEGGNRGWESYMSNLQMETELSFHERHPRRPLQHPFLRALASPNPVLTHLQGPSNTEDTRPQVYEDIWVSSHVVGST